MQDWARYLLLCLALSCNQPNEIATGLTDTQKSIRAILDETRDPCPQDLLNGQGNCAPVEIRFTKKAGRQSSLKQRILVIDHGMWEETYLTRASRVLDLVESDADGRLSTVKRTQVFARGAIRIFHDEIGVKNPRLSLRELEPFSQEIFAKFLAPARDLMIAENDHGSDILATLGELNPDAEFVVALRQEPPDFGNDLERLHRYYDTLTASYRNLIAEYGVRIINMSFGSTAQSGERAAIELEHFLKPLGSIPGVILVQAGVQNVRRRLVPNDPEYLADCATIPNRVRVGEVSFGRDDIDKDLSQSQKYALPCTDVIVNKGPKLAAVRKGHFNKDELYCASGIDIFACQYGTSYTAPLFVSYLLYLQQTHPELDTTQKLIEKATEGGVLNVKDPGAHGQFLRLVPSNLNLLRSRASVISRR